jgi:hypothetical protein
MLTYIRRIHLSLHVRFGNHLLCSCWHGRAAVHNTNPVQSPPPARRVHASSYHEKAEALSKELEALKAASGGAAAQGAADGAGADDATLAALQQQLAQAQAAAKDESAKRAAAVKEKVRRAARVGGLGNSWYKRRFTASCNGQQACLQTQVCSWTSQQTAP